MLSIKKVFDGEVSARLATGDVLKRAFALHCNGKVENKSTLTI